MRPAKFSMTSLTTTILVSLMLLSATSSYAADLYVDPMIGIDVGHFAKIT
jgi:hypothetical protein